MQVVKLLLVSNGSEQMFRAPFGTRKVLRLFDC